MDSEVTYFESSSESDSEQNELIEKHIKKRRRVTRVWRELKKYESGAEAEMAVDALKTWKKISSSTTSSGTRVEYRCTKGQYRKSECPAGLYLLYHSTSACVSLYQTENEHDNHTNIQSRGLSSDLKDFVRQKYKDGITKPNGLLHLIRENAMTEPVKSKLVEFLKTLRHDKNTPSVSASEIRTWCNDRIRIPQDEDEPYVLDFLILADSYDVEEQDIKIVITTPRLLSLARKFMRLVQADATYKLIWQGYPYLLVGTSDANYVFHPFVAAVTKGESQSDFEFIFKAIKKGVPEWKPTVLLADGSEAITNGFTSVLGDPETRLMCFFHVLKNVDKYLRLISNVDLRSEIKDDIYILQTAENPENFEKASALFLKKWEKILIGKSLIS